MILLHVYHGAFRLCSSFRSEERLLFRHKVRAVCVDRELAAMHLPHLKWSVQPPPLPPFFGFVGAAKVAAHYAR